MLCYLKDVYAACFGRRHHCERHQRYVGEMTGATNALDILNERFEHPKFEQPPIYRQKLLKPLHR